MQSTRYVSPDGSLHAIYEETDMTQNLMKGYIARERGIVVLSKAGAFPGTGV
jgi:hypothetical protein